MKEMTLLYSNENCLIEGNLYNKIKEIKPRISQSIPYENIMFLDCYGNILKDDDSFNYKSFYLYVDYKINVTIRYNGICKKTFNDIKINNSFEFIEDKIENDYDLKINKSNQMIFYKGNEIKSSFDLIKTIEKKDIEMDLYIGPKDGLLIDIKKKSGEVYKYSFTSDTKIKYIKLYNLIGLPLDSYNFFFNGKILDKEKTLKDNNIVDKSTLDFKFNSKMGNIIIIRRTWLKNQGYYSNWYKFSHNAPVNKLFPLEVDFSEKIVIIKEKFSEKDICLPIKNQKLVYNNIELEDNKSLKEYNINNEEIIDIMYKSDKKFQIIIKTLFNKIIKINADFFDTIKDIKDTIYKNEGVPQSEQMLMFGGRQLEDERTLADYGIGAESTLCLVLRLKGHTD